MSSRVIFNKSSSSEAYFSNSKIYHSKSITQPIYLYDRIPYIYRRIGRGEGSGKIRKDLSVNTGGLGFTRIEERL